LSAGGGGSTIQPSLTGSVWSAVGRGADAGWACDGGVAKAAISATTTAREADFDGKAMRDPQGVGPLAATAAGSARSDRSLDEPTQRQLSEVRSKRGGGD